MEVLPVLNLSTANQEVEQTAAALEKRFMDFYNDLVTRQQNSEKLEQTKVEKFYAMRAEYFAHPRIVARNDALGAFKPILAEAGEQISAQPGLDFTELARAAQREIHFANQAQNLFCATRRFS